MIRNVGIVFNKRILLPVNNYYFSIPIIKKNKTYYAETTGKQIFSSIKEPATIFFKPYIYYFRDCDISRNFIFSY